VIPPHDGHVRGAAKLELLRYLHRHAPEVEARILAVETVDHPPTGSSR
jgi:hypothetical protein